MEYRGYLQQLADYIKKNLAKGYTTDSLKTALIAQGYSRMQIDKAIQLANQQLAKTAPRMVEKPVIKVEVEPIIEEKKSLWQKIKSWFEGRNKEEELVDMSEMFPNKHISEHSQKLKTNKEVFDMSKYKELI